MLENGLVFCNLCRSGTVGVLCTEGLDVNRQKRKFCRELQVLLTRTCNLPRSGWYKASRSATSFLFRSAINNPRDNRGGSTNKHFRSCILHLARTSHDAWPSPVPHTDLIGGHRISAVPSTGQADANRSRTGRAKPSSERIRHNTMHER
jgi:hypothetical protein